jgi:hypothetical protein
MVSIRTQAYELEFHIYMRMDAQFGLVLHHIQYDHYDENHEMLITVTNPEIFYQIELESIVLLIPKDKNIFIKFKYKLLDYYKKNLKFDLIKIIK